MAPIVEHRARRLRRAPIAILLLVALGSPMVLASAEAEELGVTGDTPEPAEPPPDVAPGPDVGLDRLLELPSSMNFDQQSRNGASPEAWRARFRASFAEIQEAEDKIAQTRRELDQMAVTGGGGQWQMAPPGSNNTEVTPMSFKLREALRAGREELEEAERKHRELVIQADLAGVPEDWRQP